MNDFVRKQKVAELNRILPMVRETIRKEKHFNNILETQDEKKEELKEVEEIISRFEFLITILAEEKDFSKSALEEFQLVLDAQKKKKEELVILLADYNSEVNQYINELDFELRLYKSITSTIATYGGFLKNEEIQEEFLEEYLYLLLFVEDSLHKNFNMKTCFESPNYFYTFTEKVVPPNFWVAVDNRIMYKNRFFEIFS